MNFVNIEPLLKPNPHSARCDVFFVTEAAQGFNPDDLVDSFEWCKTVPAKLRIFVPGNHDYIFNTNQDRARSLIPDGVVYLENEDLEYDSIRFYSVPARHSAILTGNWAASNSLYPW